MAAIASTKFPFAYAKANPGKVNYASAGAGNANHISAEMFKTMTGVDMVHVPINGGAPAVLALVSGRVDVMFADTLTAGERAKAGTIRAIGVARIPGELLVEDRSAARHVRRRRQAPQCRDQCRCECNSH